jgi:hypothetical protein
MYRRLSNLRMTRLMSHSVTTKQFYAEAFRRLDNLRYMACRFASFQGFADEWMTRLHMNNEAIFLCEVSKGHQSTAVGYRTMRPPIELIPIS